jgi:hypothetical protein
VAIETSNKKQVSAFIQVNIPAVLSRCTSPMGVRNTSAPLSARP